MTTPDLTFAIGLPPEDAIKYFEGKGLRLTGDWRELWQEQHAKAFTVARLAKLDVLKDIHDALNDALKNGTTERQFIKDMTPLLQKKGWWGPAVDKQTGEVLETYDDISGRPVEWGSPRRLKLIYRQNMQTAYMAGRYKQQQELANATGPGARPYWQYIAVRDSRTRPTHSALHGRVWRADDPIWTHLYPPNGWNCRCRVRALSEFRMRKEGLTAESSDGQLVTRQVQAGKRPDGSTDMREVTGIRILDRDGRESVMLPDAGWSYNPGRAWLETDPHWNWPDCDGLAALNTGGGKPCIRVVEGLKTWKDHGRPDLRHVPDSLRAPAPAILEAAPTRVDAELVMREALGLAAVGESVRIIQTPVEPVLLHSAWIPHMVEKVDNARERYAHFILPTLQTPFEVYDTDYDDGFSRMRYIGLFSGAAHIMVVVRIAEDGRLFWNFMNADEKRMNKQREGRLLYWREGE